LRGKTGCAVSALRSPGTGQRVELLDHGVEGALLAPAAQKTPSMSKGAALVPFPIRCRECGSNRGTAAHG
jgi:hypothetical protein